MNEQESKEKIKQLENIIQVLFEEYVPDNRKGAFMREYHKLIGQTYVEPPSAKGNSAPLLGFLD